MEFRNVSNKTGKIRVWRIEVNGDTIVTESGELGGQFVQTRDVCPGKNHGRSNYLTPEQDAALEAERLILEKERQGYRRYEEGATEAVLREIDPHLPLPQNLRFYKPDNEISSEMMEKIAAGAVVFTRKRDGEAMIVRVNGLGEVEIYSRRMYLSHHLEETPWAERFPHWVEAAKDLPPNTILLGEAVSDPDRDDRWRVAQVLKSKTDKAVDLQQERPVQYYVWDVAMYDGRLLVRDVPALDRFELLFDICEKASVFHPIEVYGDEDIRSLASISNDVDTDSISGWANYPKNWQDAVKAALHRGWEGFVAIDVEAPYGQFAMNFSGKDYRPSHASAKIKPEFEDDFVALFDPSSGDGEWGRGKRLSQVGAVSLYQINREGEYMFICKCGGGIDDDFMEKYSSPESYPLVVRVQYATRTYGKSNALQFPRILEVRSDKDPEECINHRLGKGHG
jgi:ATP-dependent DNA ligase